MNKIKIIELLNMISEGQEVPKKIRYSKVYTCDLVYNEYRKDYCVNGKYYMFLDRFRSREENYEEVIYHDFLNDEVEIIGEPKKIEKIKSNGDEFYSDYIDTWINKNNTDAYCEFLMNKINEIIDEINNLKENN